MGAVLGFFFGIYVSALRSILLCLLSLRSILLLLAYFLASMHLACVPFFFILHLLCVPFSVVTHMELILLLSVAPLYVLHEFLIIEPTKERGGSPRFFFF